MFPGLIGYMKNISDIKVPLFSAFYYFISALNVRVQAYTGALMLSRAHKTRSRLL